MSKSLGDDSCPLCSEVIEVHAIGQCDHPVCYRCSTRMRVLCEQHYCAICRADMPKVVFVSQRREFSSIKTFSFPVNRKCSVYFENENIQAAFSKLLEHKCGQCGEKAKSFRSFVALKDHMRKEHGVFCCDLCVTNVKLFSHERKWYDRKKLAEHRRKGDLDDKSHKGHPLCQFCEERYFDNDHLLVHLRKQHYYCHFCEADGITNEYFSEYSYLRDHFAAEHFLCEEDDCAHTEFTNAFRSEIDLKAHKASDHSRTLKKAAAKQARRLDIDFSITGGPSGTASKGHSGGRGRGPRREQQSDRGGVITGEDFEEVNSSSRHHGRGRMDNSRRQAQIRQREELEAAQAMSASLSEMQSKGHVNMIEPGLMQPLTGAMSQQRPGAVLRAESFEENTADFPTLDGRTVHRGSSDEETSSKPEQGREAKRSMAKTFALANNFSVQDGSMAEEEFPSLGGTKKPRGFNPATRKVTNTAWAGSVNSTDYPELQSAGKAKNAKAPAGPNPMWKSGPSSSSQRSQPTPKPQTKAAPPASSQVPSTRSLNDFPSLSSIGGSLVPPSIKHNSATGKGKDTKAARNTPSADPKWLQKNTSSSQEQRTSAKQEPEEFVFPKKTVPKAVGKHKKLKEEDYPTLGSDSKQQKKQKDKTHENATSSPKVTKKSKSQTKNGTEDSLQDTSKAASSQNEGLNFYENLASKEITLKSIASKTDLENNYPSLSKDSPKANKKSAPEMVRKSEDTFTAREMSPSMKKQKGPDTDLLAEQDFPSLSSGNVKAPGPASWGPQKGKNKRKKKKGKSVEDADSDKPSPYQSEGENDAPRVPKPTDSTLLQDKLSEVSATKPVLSLKDIVSSVEAPSALRDQSNMPKVSLPSEPAPADLKLEDFPSLLSPTSNSVPTAPPPGFSKPAPPPPGFSSVGVSKAPPPGFNNKLQTQSSSSDMPGNSQGASAISHEYIQPTNFQQRNQRLIQDITNMCSDNGKFANFRTCSGDFRQGRLGARDYFSRCVEVLGAASFQKVFPELLVLLPDISKQQELLVAYRDSTMARGKGGKGKKVWNNPDTSFKTCGTCEQVLSGEDYTLHLAAHNLDTDFPALGAPGFMAPSLSTLA